jgi:hypothetical protein
VISTPKIEDIPATLRRAATIVRAGWMQNSYYNKFNNTSCALGSVARAVVGDDLTKVLQFCNDMGSRDPVFVALRKELEVRTLGEISFWNDSSGCTAFQVARVMERAAARYEREHPVLAPAPEPELELELELVDA